MSNTSTETACLNKVCLQHEQGAGIRSMARTVTKRILFELYTAGARMYVVLTCA